MLDEVMVIAMRRQHHEVRDVPFAGQSSTDVPSALAERRKRLEPWLNRSDFLADQAIEELSHLPHGQQFELIKSMVKGGHSSSSSPYLKRLDELYQQAEAASQQYDSERTQRAGSIFFRAGALGGLTLGLRSLIYGYADPRGNKPLVFTGQLEQRAARRLAETGKFVTAVCEPNGMQVGQPGFHAALHVRLMHARVRYLLRDNPTWRAQRWGVPINQHDMLATTLLFSNIFMEGVELLGVSLEQEEKESFQALWSQIGAVMGVEPTLLPSGFDEAQLMSQAIRSSQSSADEDSRQLVRALLDQPLRTAKTLDEKKKARRQIAIAEGLACDLLDQRLVSDLRLKRPSVSVMKGIRLAIQPLEMTRKVIKLDAYVEERGRRYWNKSIEMGLTGVQELFPIPLRLYGERASIPV